jgi:ABC-type branched-subunit amino acid transport system substrate-binding protein
VIARAIEWERAAARLPVFVVAAVIGALDFAGASAQSDDRPIVVTVAPLSGARGTIAVAMIGSKPADRVAFAANFRSEILDDRCSAEGARTVAQRIATRGHSEGRVVAVIGHPCASAAAAAARYYDAAGITFFPTTPFVPETASGVGAGGASGSRLIALVDGSVSEGQFLGQRVAGDVTSSAHQLAVISDATAAMRIIARDAAEAARAAGAQRVVLDTMPAGARDFDVFAGRLVAAGITHLVLAAYPAEAWLLIDALGRAGAQPVILAASALASEPPPAAVGEASARVRIVQRPSYSAAPVVPEDAAATRAGALTAIALDLVVKRGSAPDLSAALRATAVELADRTIRFDAKGRSDLPPWEFVTWDGARWRQ